MARKGKPIRHDTPPDAVYGSPLVQRFINSMMWDGKKSTAARVFYGSMDIMKEKANEDPLKVFQKAIDNVKPTLEVKSRRVGGANYQIPIEVNSHRRLSLAIRWLLQYSRGRAGRNMKNRLAEELLDAYNNRGGAIKKKDDTHRMAEANKAFAHYRW